MMKKNDATVKCFLLDGLYILRDFAIGFGVIFGTLLLLFLMDRMPPWFAGGFVLSVDESAIGLTLPLLGIFAVISIIIGIIHASDKHSKRVFDRNVHNIYHR